MGEIRGGFQAQGMAVPTSGGGRELASFEELRGSWGVDGQGVTARERSLSGQVRPSILRAVYIFVFIRSHHGRKPLESFKLGGDMIRFSF